MKEFLTTCEEETFFVAGEIAKSLKNPTIIVLEGDVGAGKTHFVKGFAKALGYEDIVTSPTFTILNEYECDGFYIYHFDMYRLSSMEDAVALGFEEYLDLNNLNGFALVEWAENVEGLIPKEAVKVQIFKEGERKRRIVLI